MSPFLSILIMDELRKKFQDEVPWCILFINDIVFANETTYLDMREALERKGLGLVARKQHIWFATLAMKHDEYLVH